MSNDLEPLMVAVSPDAPSGTDLEYDPDFSRMEKAAQGTADQEFGSTKIEGTPADWDEVHDAAVSLLRRSRDLRAATYLAEAELTRSGVIGFRNALELIHVYIDKFWETVYPQLDADDDNDPTIRINSLAGLCKVGGVIRQLRLAPILMSRSVGKFSWTDCAIAKGEIPVPAGMESPPTQKQIDAAVMASDPKEFADLVQAVADSIKFVSAIEEGFSDRLGPAIGPNLELLTKELKAISRFQTAWVAMRKQDDNSGAVNDSDPSTGLMVASTPQAQSPPPVPVKGSFVITRREDVIEGLDKIIQWLERNEPSSPLPMLLKRAKRLSTMSFMDILRDISPDGLSQAVLISGPDPETDVTATTSSRKDDPDDGY
ncbi:MAG: type VI secretion system protein TssA [Pirellulaceae bacterium]|nr:type VI secretion system protein TssA [Pirellulaceae bacterium]